MKLALIGKNICHSESESIYAKLHSGKIDYTLIDIPNDESLPSLESLFNNYDGVSITSPYKKSYFNLVTTEASLSDLGIINTLKLENGSFYGFLTDRDAFREIFKTIDRNDHSSIALIGDGDMGSMVSRELTNNNIEYVQYSRKLENLDQIPSNSQLIINTCSREYVFDSLIDSEATFWDFNYNFPPHQKLKNRCHYIDGMGLLEEQASYALKHWQS